MGVGREALSALGPPLIPEAGRTGTPNPPLFQTQLQTLGPKAQDMSLQRKPKKKGGLESIME